MVDKIDIHKLNLEELNGVISIYPWYAGARMELCSRLAGMGILSENQAAEAALYVNSRHMIYELLRKKTQEDYTDSSTPVVEEEPRQIFIAGGDFFSQSQYESVKRSEDNVFSKFASKAHAEGYKEDLTESVNDEDLYTETLARIYLEQDYPEKAMEIYSKLILRYPEKSVYFAALIDEIKKNYNQL